MPRYLYVCAVGAVGLALLRADTPGDHDRPAGASVAASSGVAVLRSELDAMEAAGLPADHPKVEMLRDDLASFERGVHTAAPVEPGVDQVAGQIDAATRAADADGAADEASLDDGRVDCEPLPGLLTAADVADARCSSLVQPDGSNLYVADRPDGTRTTVHFAPDGTVTRLP